MARTKRSSSNFPKPVKTGRHERFGPLEVAEAVEKANGIVAAAARLLNCDRTTVQRYIDTYAVVKAAYDQAWETNFDASEHVLLTALRSRDATVSVPVAKWFLMTRGKERGYVEKVDIRVSIERERERVREEAKAAGLDADLAVAEFERILAGAKR